MILAASVTGKAVATGLFVDEEMAPGADGGP
jgi:hypothetical protein